MKKSLAILLTAAMVLSLSTSKAKAAPANFQLTLTTDTEVNLFISILGGAVSALVPFDLSGTVDAAIDDAIQVDLVNDSTGLSLIGADIDIGDLSINIPAGFLGGVAAEITGGGINTLTTNGYVPLNSTNGANPFTYTFDPGAGGPTQLAIDQGLFTYLGTGAAGGLIGSGTIDFNAEPIEAELPPVGQIGMVTQNAVVSDGFVYVTVSAPITFTDQLLTDPVEVSADLSGALVATGSYALVPEPSTVVLLGIALIGMIPVIRRMRK